MTPAELRRIGEQAFGPDWQSPLARLVGVTPRHMRRLAAGDRPVTPALSVLIEVRTRVAAPRSPAPDTLTTSARLGVLAGLRRAQDLADLAGGREPVPAWWRDLLRREIDMIALPRETS